MNHFSRIAASLDKAGVEGVLLSAEYNRFYATGFHSMGEDGMAVVTKEGNFFFTDSRYIEAAGAQISFAAIGEVKRGMSYVQWINEVIDLYGIKRLGFEDQMMSWSEWNRLKGQLHAELVPFSAVLNQLRQVKDDEEKSRLIAAQRISEKALDQILKEIKPGITEKEIAARLQYLMLSEGAEKMSFDPIIASGTNGSMPHAVPTDKPVEKGEFVTMDFGCIYQGYCSDMTRTVAVGEPTEEMKKVYQIVLDAQLAGIAMAKAGSTGQEIDGAARKVIENAGYGEYFGHGFGHGVGIEIHEYPNANSANTEPMPSGAVISAEPGIYIPGKFGVRIEDVVMLNDTGCEVITLANKNLIIL